MCFGTDSVTEPPTAGPVTISISPELTDIPDSRYAPPVPSMSVASADHELPRDLNMLGDNLHEISARWGLSTLETLDKLLVMELARSGAPCKITAKTELLEEAPSMTYAGLAMPAAPVAVPLKIEVPPPPGLVGAEYQLAAADPYQAAAADMYPFLVPPPPVPHPAMLPVPDCPSIGSLGHPMSCGLACKYHTKGGRCKDGRNCERCHLCTWTKYGTSAPAEKVAKQAPPASIGSKGHPTKCQKACKYFRRKGGCRDGMACEKCHICHWSWRCNSPSSLRGPQPLHAPLRPGLLSSSSLD